MLNRLRPRSGLFYGWWLVVIGAVILAVGGGEGSFRDVVLSWLAREELGQSGDRLYFTLFWSGASLTAGLLAIAGGVGVDRFGPRRMLQIGLASIGVGFLLSIQSILPGTFYLTLLALHLGAAIGIWLPVYTLMNNWFQRRKATGISLVLLGGPVADSVTLFLYPALTLSPQFDVFRLVLGIGVLVSIWPVSIMIRNRPSEGVDANGVTDEPAVPYSAIAPPGMFIGSRPDFTWIETFRSRAYWLITIGQVAAGCATSSVLIIQSLIMSERGISITAAALVSVSASVATTMGILVGGLLGDRIPIRFAVVGFLLVQIVGGGSALIFESHEVFLVATVVVGFGTGASMPVAVAIRGVYFGRRNFATITAVSVLIVTVFRGLGSVPVLWIYSATTNLSLTLAGIIAVGVLGCVMLIVAGSPRLAPSQRIPGIAPGDEG